MRFFYPKPSFCPWITSVHAKHKLPIVDVGCGEGHLVRLMRKWGLPAMGIDSRFSSQYQVPVDLISCILAMPMEDCRLIRNDPMILLMCRPCHGGFTHDVNELRHRDSLLYYIGLDRNLSLDWGDTHIKFVKDNVGREGERVWSVGKRS